MGSKLNSLSMFVLGFLAGAFAVISFVIGHGAGHA